MAKLFSKILFNSKHSKTVECGELSGNYGTSAASWWCNKGSQYAIGPPTVRVEKQEFFL